MTTTEPAAVYTPRQRLLGGLLYAEFPIGAMFAAAVAWLPRWSATVLGVLFVANIVVLLVMACLEFWASRRDPGEYITDEEQFDGI